MSTLPTDGIPQLGLWANRAFVRLWIAKTVSGIGSSITATAIPLTAAFTLDATPGQMVGGGERPWGTRQ